jgi:exopolyphosphatase/guanosine-5'-triphosphate,3'-diphosphate pyrophosphatase
MSAGAKKRVVAAIDVGSAAVRMDVAEIGPNGSVRILDTLHRASTLGRDSFADGVLSQETIESCVAVLQEFKAAAEEYGPEVAIRAVGTSALREARNRDLFLDRAYIATGLEVEPIEEPEVHRYTYLALYRVLADKPFMRRGNVLVVEVGGGGTKVLLIQNGFVTVSETFRLGSVRVREALEGDGEAEAHPVEALSRQVDRMMDQARRVFPVSRVPNMVAVIGDLPPLLIHALRRITGAPEAEEGFATPVPVDTFLKTRALVGLSETELVRRYQLTFQEAETAGPALLAYLRLAEAFRVRQVILARADLRLGLLFQMAGGGGWTDHFREQVVRSALALGRKYAFDERHAQHVTAMALRLFDELASDHRLTARHRQLLHVAGLLHDIGTFVSARSHHKHSMYLVRSSELFGLTTADTELIALVVRYHRRSEPGPQHPEFVRLNRADRALVLVLAALLRVADALDRSHTQRIRITGCARQGGVLAIGVEEVGDLSLERVAIENKGHLFETVFGLRVELQPARLPSAR